MILCERAFRKKISYLHFMTLKRIKRPSSPPLDYLI